MTQQKKNGKRLFSLALALLLALSLAVPAMAVDGGAKQSFPARFDLRDLNLVSNPKSQNPFGSCWSFGSISAAEISILAQLRELSPAYAEYYADPNALDLSELQLAWFAYTPIVEENPNDPHSQAGEGQTVYGEHTLDAGGWNTYAAMIFSNGIGPILEEDAPYRNAEGAKDEDGYLKADENGNFYDWSLPEEIRFLNAFELTDANVLPPLWVAAGDEMVYNREAIDAIKSELMQKRGVSLSMFASTSRPGQTDPEGDYINTDTWAHYTYDNYGSNHVVCIVGWDDNYSKSNFLPDHQPPEDGAWIVKNSWGSADSEFPNHGDWGVDGSGYFYLSYYDTSIQRLESFVFDLEENYFGGDDSMFLVDQYDYLPGIPTAYTYEDPATGESKNYQIANVFTAEMDQNIRALGLDVDGENQTVTLEVYRLKENASSPVDGEKLYGADTTFRYGGFHRVNLPQDIYLPQGAQYSVVATMKRLPLSTENQWIDSEPPTEGAYAKAVINPNESFFAIEDVQPWTDWTVFAESYRKVTMENAGGFEQFIPVVDNPALKAYSSPARTLNVRLNAVVPADQAVTGGTMRITAEITNPMSFEVRAVNLKSALGDLTDKDVIEVIPAGESATVEYTHTLTAEEIAHGSLVESLTVSLPYDRDFPQTTINLPLYLTEAPAGGDVLAAAISGQLILPTANGIDLDGAVTRGDVVRALYRINGGSNNAGAVPVFSDIPAGSDLAAAAGWAAAAGVANGYGNGTFGANDPVTREQLAAMLYRYAQTKDQGFKGAWMFLLDFPDAAEVSDYADEAMHWVVMNDIISGTADGRLAARDGATRVQLALILDRYLKAIGGDGFAAAGTETPAAAEPLAGAVLSSADGVKLTIPEAANETLIVTQILDQTRTDGIEELFRIEEKASVEAAKAKGEPAANGMGWLCTIGRVTPEVYGKLITEDMSGVEVIAYDGSTDRYYVRFHPTDVRLDRAGELTEADSNAWIAANELANKMVAQFITDNGFEAVTVGNSVLDIYLNRIAYLPNTEYSIAFLTDGEQAPHDVDALPFYTQLTHGVTFEPADNAPEGSFDGEYYVLNIKSPEQQPVRIDFLTNGQNYIRLVMDGSEYLYRAVYADGETVSSQILQAWYEALVAANAKQ